MENGLEKVLAESDRMVTDALARAREELSVLNERRAHLEALIAQAEAVQRSVTSSSPGSKRLTLHEAISIVLEEESNRWMTVRELAEVVNARALYRKKDGSHVEANQIHARTKNYEQLFEKDGPNVRLRVGSIGTK